MSIGVFTQRIGVARGTFLRPLLAFVACLPMALQSAPSAAATTTLNPIADAYVEGGSWANVNFGTSTGLFAQTSNNGTSSYDSYLKFDTSGAGGTGSVASAKLRISASLASGSIGMSVYAVSDTSWAETAITWNNKPARGGALASTTVTGNSFIYYELDVSSYLIAEKAAGRNIISFALHNPVNSSRFIWMQSRETTSGNPPQLVLTLNPKPTSLAPDPLAITAGASGTLTATLSPAPPAAGTLSVTSANTAVATAPASVGFAAGQTSVPIPVTALAVGSAIVTASANGGSASATVNVTPAPPTVTSLAPAALSLTQGASGTLTVKISAAQAAATAVALASGNSGVAFVDASVTVPAGAVSAPVPVAAVSPGTAQVTASLNGSSVSSQVTVTAAPASVVSLVPVLEKIALGANTSLILTLSSAQATDTVVALAASPAGLVSVPASVTVPAAQTSIVVPVASLALGQAGIAATLNGSSASAAVNVVPPPAQLVAVEPPAYAMTVGATSSFTVRINAAQLTNTEIALSTNNPAGLQLPASVTIAQGQTSASFTATALATGGAIITAAFNDVQKTAGVQIAPQAVAIVSLVPSPLPLQQGAVGALTVTINAAQATDTAIALASSAPGIVQVPATVTVPAGASAATITVTALAAGAAQVTASVNSTRASAAIEVAAPLPVVTAITPATLTLPKGTPGVLRVSVSRAPNVATAVTLASRNPSFASVPATVNIPAGALFADFPVAANSPGQATISASLNGGAASAVVTITPEELAALTLSPAPASAYVGESVRFTATGTMTDGTTRDFTTSVLWSSRSDNVVVASINGSGLASALAAGTATIEASFGFVASATGQNVTISTSTVLTVKQPVALVLTSPTTTLVVGNSTTVTVTSSDPAPAGGLTATLTQNGTGSASFPPAVQIPANGTSTSFTLTASAAGDVTVTAAAFERLPGSITFTIQPAFRIDSVTPATGAVESLVTLVGAGFDPVPANNQVAFRGINNTTVSATVLSVTPTVITVRVPALADSGPITLTNSRGTAQSPPFTVTREQDYQLVASPASVTVPQGASGAVQVQLSSTGTKTYTGLVTLSTLGLPSGVSASFAPAATLSAFQTGTVTFGATATATPGNYPVTIRADAKEGGQPFFRTASVNLLVQAATGVTGVKGRFVTPDNQGIAGVIVRADIDPTTQPTTTTDTAGNFLLLNLPAGPVTLRFDATPANPLYPIWPYTVTLAANQVNILPDWTINPPPSADKFTPIANAAQDQIITDTRFPGLEVKLPAGVTITGWDGVVKTRIAVERHDPDKLGVSPPPIPTKSVFQLYFGTPMGGLPSAPIPVTFPNDVGLQPGERTNIWFYDGSPMGGTGEWKIAGQGAVSADGKVVVPDPGSGIPRFCGHCGLGCIQANQDSAPNPPCPSSSNNCPSGTAGAPVTLATGQELLGATDLRIAGLVPMSVDRTYNPFDALNSITGTALSLGFGWALSYDVVLFPLSTGLVRIVLAGNSRIDFTPDGTGGFAVAIDTRFYGARLSSLSSGWELRFKDGRVWRFGPFGGVGLQLLVERRDTNGNSLTISRNSSGKILSVQGGQRTLQFNYGPNGFVSAVNDPLGRTIAYSYNAQNQIASVTAPDNGVTSYTYANDLEFPGTVCPSIPGGLRLKTIQRPGQTALQTLFYGPGRRVLRETLEDGSESKFSYSVVGACVTHVSNPSVKCTVNCPSVDSWDNFQAGWRISGGSITAATYTDANGQSTTQRFNGNGLGTQVADAQGQLTQYVRDGTNRVTSITDALGRTTQYQYDANGNKTQETDALGHITGYTYDPKWNKVTSVTRTLEGGTQVTQTFVYDLSTGNLTTSTDPLGNVTTYAYTPQGQVASVTNPIGKTTSFIYNAAGDMVALTDPLGNQTQLTPDTVGRITTTTDPLGFRTQSAYNEVDQLTTITDAGLGVTQLNYDARRNLASVVNPLETPIESYQYDNLNRITQRTDAKLRSTLYQYDGAGNLSQLTDRKGQVTGISYDSQNRPVQINYPDGATQTRSYDAVGRLTELRESDNSIAFTYDTVNRVIRVATDNAAGRHEIGYVYDNLNRVVSRTVDGGDATSYTYDKASRPITINYRNQTTTYVWDNASRLSGKTLPDGIVQSFSYDDANRIIQIQYLKPDTSVIETIAYTYDAKGQRLTKASDASSAQETTIAATYDTANRMTSLTLTATGQTFNLAYDDNGNLATKTDAANPSSVTTYTWDSRNRLTAINAPGITATFQYDALGRRAAKTVNGQTIGYVYDGLQAIGEVTGGTISTTILTTLAIDDVVARYTQAGARTYLTDALGSVLALAKDDQSIQAFYAYTPYGEATTLGDDEGNPIQYTARENDQTGLYFYRARYYDPVLKRFIQEDPIGLLAGANSYSYVGGNPVSYADPTGRNPLVVGVIVGAVVGGISGAISSGNTIGWSWQNADQIALSAAIGVGFGAVGGLAIGAGLTAYASGALIGGLAGFAGNVAGQRASGTQWSCIDWRQAGFQGFVGLVAGAAAGPAYGPYAVANAALWAAGLTGATSLAGNSVVSTGLGGFGFANLVQ